MQRRDTKNLSSDRNEEAPLSELTSNANIVRRKREYPMNVGYAPRQLYVCLLEYGRR
jgi:hypothetical protein